MNRVTEQIISIPVYLSLYGAVAPATHWDMTKDCSNVRRLKRATFEEVKEKMLNANWVFVSRFPDSLFSPDFTGENYFHAGIIRFGDVGYLLTPYGYYRAMALQRQIRKALVGGSNITGKPLVKTKNKLYENQKI